ncbi:MAG: hypothetical protein KZQ93_08510 [Candidatus Thiodiazotropha sp. (ex Monitilora ramsayi)]|nr:hypothetical protein [Candidatus Thiodiazotropha sp. (ex Monitilora ramsayi)]
MKITKHKWRGGLLYLPLLPMLLIAAPAAHAASSYINAWSSLYPASSSEDLVTCKICHAASNQNLNPYGKAVCDEGGTIQQRIQAVEAFNSDGDPTGSNNLTEIEAGTQMGWTDAAVPTYNRGDCSPTGQTELPSGLVAFFGNLDPSVVPEVCDNGVDDNGDGLIDCADPGCNAAVVGSTSCGIGACATTGDLVCQGGTTVDTCTPGTPGAEGPFGDVTCSDGIDNNCDGAIDDTDLNCFALAENCNNGIDDNLDGNIDCADPQCDGFVYSETACGVGACSAIGQEVCQAGTIVDTCSPANPVGEGPFGDATCSDGVDNDCDGMTDVADMDCEAPAEICDNGIDDNLNGLTDCADAQCDGFVGSACVTGQPGICAAGTSVCQGGAQVCEQNQPAGTEGPFSSITCTDGLDNDCDNLTDLADPDCESIPEVCDNGIDDNGDGLTDCVDPACDGFVGGACDTGNLGVCATGTSVCRNQQQFCDQNEPIGTEGPFGSATCTDGLDNDCDGLSDANDPDCSTPPEICDNGVDDNGDGLADCTDPQCDGITFGACDTGNPGVCGAGTLTCDGSGAEPVCTQNQAAGTEGPFGSASCADGLDNDCDGLSDAVDPDCDEPVVVVEICDNGIDDSGNGLVDCQDPACDGFVSGVCNTGSSGICAAGTSVCQSGAQACVQDQPAGTEGPIGSPTCADGLDNDCDGLSDGDDLDCIEPFGDVYLKKLRAPEGYDGEEGHVEKKTIKVRGGGSVIEQNATVVLSADASPNLGVVIRNAEATKKARPGRRTQFEFKASISCIFGGQGIVDWTAMISAPGNDNPTNDVVTGRTEVDCKYERKRKDEDDHEDENEDD